MFDIAVRCIVFITGDISFWHFTASQVIHSLLLYILDIINIVESMPHISDLYLFLS